MFIIAYLAIGIALSFFVYFNDGGEDRRASTHAGYLLFFALLWPLILGYIAHAVWSRGVLKYKGKVIWQAKGKR